MKKKIFIFVSIIFFIFIKSVFASNIEIKVKIQDDIITNIDIKNEKNYLLFLNPKLKELEKFKLNNLAKDSIINDIIKKKELEKNFDFDNIIYY